MLSRDHYLPKHGLPGWNIIDRSPIKLWRKELNAASQARDAKALAKAIERARAANYDNLLDLQIVMAGRLRDQLERIERLRHSILNLDSRTVSELKSYKNPKVEIHQSMRAAFTLLGFSQKETQEWASVPAILGKTGKESIMRKIREFEPTACYLDVALAAKAFIEPYNLEQVRDNSAGAATFYVWAKGMIEEVESTGGAKRDEGVGGGGGGSKKKPKKTQPKSAAKKRRK
ncbi:hypothetical protein FSP39_014158 [Pinctada imbricata]|uniref:Uncharacterized protein n=1 Tax=Pinctada imbricata TaxID=66713 RepID=A0AA88XS89_PINIB|nr:hypothetical protein FSP39_014158 [Pinctada imbricata]